MHRGPRTLLQLLSATLVAGVLAAPASAQAPDSAGSAPRPAVRRPAGTPPTSGEPRAVARDLVRADDGRCDDLCRRERMMDSLYGKDRERRPAARRAPASPAAPPLARP